VLIAIVAVLALFYAVAQTFASHSHNSAATSWLAPGDGSIESSTTAQPTTIPPTTTTLTDSATGTQWTENGFEKFNGSSLSNNWSIYNGAGNEGVGLRRPSAISVNNGQLTITGTGNVSGGLAQHHSQTYGRWDIRARMDKGDGYGPAILLWPDSERWPQDGELDIVEIPLGDRSSAFMSSHFGADNEKISKNVPGDFSQWHTYSVEWLQDKVTFLIDNVPMMVITDRAAIPHKSMHLAIQNDVGAAGHTIPPRDASTPSSVALHVDWVKTYSPSGA
jgi:beta-glucanase (GH16 family)